MNTLAIPCSYTLIYYGQYDDRFINNIKDNIEKLIKGFALNQDRDIVEKIKKIFKNSLKPPYKGGIYFKGRFKPEVIASALVYYVLKNSKEYKKYFGYKNRYTKDDLKKISARKIAEMMGITQASINRQNKFFEKRYYDRNREDYIKEIEIIIGDCKIFYERLLNSLDFTDNVKLTLRSKANEIFEDLKGINPKMYIKSNTDPRVLAGAIFYLISKILEINEITFLTIRDIFNDKRVAFRKKISKLYTYLKVTYGHSFKELVESTIRKVLDGLRVSVDHKRNIIGQCTIILEDILRPIPEGGLCITANTNPKVVAGAIIYVIPKITGMTKKITSVKISKLLDVTPTSIKKYYYNNFRDKYINIYVNSEGKVSNRDKM